MKVLVIHNDYQQHGGERVAVSSLITLLRDRGHRVIIYSRSNDELTQYRLLEKAAFFPRTIYSYEAFQEIRALVAQERPDIAHVHNVFPLISPAVYHALKQANVPIVQTIYNFRLLCPNGLFYTHGQICERCKYGNTLHAVHYRCYHKSYVLSALYATTIAVHRLYGTFALIDCFLPPAEFTARKLIEGGIASGDKIRVLPYFLPDPLPNCGSFTQRQSHVIYLGRLSAEKGLWTLLEAVSGMPGVHLKIFGDGPLADPLRAYVTERGLANVEMAGFVAGEDKWDALRAALCVVVPSEWYENSPFTVLESMAAGTPVIASNLGSLSDVVASYKNGLLFKPSDNRDLQDKLTWLIQHRDKALTMGRYGRQVVESNHSAESHYQQLMRIYNEVKN